MIKITNLSDVKANASRIREICALHGAENVRIFGSFLHNKQTLNSDLDLLIDWSDDRDLFQRVDLKNHLENEIGRKIDLVVAKNLHHLIQTNILEEALTL